MTSLPRDPDERVRKGAFAPWWPWAAATLGAVLLLVAYWDSFSAPWLFDDRVAITENPSIKQSGDWIAWMFPPLTATSAGRPLFNLSLAFNYAWSGDDVWSYHLVNLVIHVLAAATLFALVRHTLTKRPRWSDAAGGLSAAIAILWALHPVQTETVTYISQRSESLAALFYLVTLWAFARANDATHPMRWKTLSVMACLCGVATKEIVVTAPLMALLYDGVFGSGSLREALRRHRGYFLGLAAAWVWLGFLIVATQLGARGIGLGHGVTWWRYALVEAHAILRYLQLAVWPHPLVFDYGPQVAMRDGVQLWGEALVLLAGLAGVAWVWRRSPVAGFLGVAFFVLLAPTSSVVPIADQPMAESRMYLPLVPVIVLVVLATFRWCRSRAPAIYVVLALLLAGASAARNHTYRDAIGLWSDTVAKQPDNARAHGHLAVELSRIAGREREAANHYETAVRLKPDDAEMRSNLALLLARIPGREREALPQLEQAVRSRPGDAALLNNLALELAKTAGRESEARACYEEALRLKPDFVAAHVNLGNELAKLAGREDEALRHFSAALTLDPRLAATYQGRAALLMRFPARWPEALADYRRAVELDPGSRDAHVGLVVGLLRAGRLDEALGTGDAALRTHPSWVELHKFKGDALAAQAKWVEAVASYEAVLRSIPAWADAHASLGLALLQAGRRDEAVAHFTEAVRLDPNQALARDQLNRLSSNPGTTPGK